MMGRFFLLVVLVVELVSQPWPVSSEPLSVKWQELRPHFWLAKSQTWHEITFSAIKVHLGYYSLSLVDIGAYRDENIDQIRALESTRQSSNSLVDAGIEAVMRTWPDQEKIVAVSSAGWSKNLRSAQQSGLLRIGGKEVAEFDERETLNSIVCLHSPIPKYKNYEYQVPILLRADVAWQLQEASVCKDGLQVGPSILERHLGIASNIQQVDPNAGRSVRVVLAVDHPQRGSSPATEPQRENARDAIILITENDVSLASIQEMLSFPDFYGEGANPYWAVNMAGGGPSGLVVADPDAKMPIEIGNTSGTIGSALVVTMRGK